MALQNQVQHSSLSDPQAFWARHAQELHWHRQPDAVLHQSTKQLASGVSHPNWSWFPGGEISTSYNCIDRHVNSGHGQSTAIIWDSPVTQSKRRYSYDELLHEVETLASVLRDEGVRKGDDVVLVYMPMIPAALFGILAIARLGAIHAVVFGGFSSASLAQRIDASKPRLILTASCGIEGAKGPISYKSFIEGAIQKSKHKVPRILIYQREQLRWDPVSESKGQREWQVLVQKAKDNGSRADCVPVKSSDGLYIIYTSGTTGSPKGVLREAGGHAVGLQLSMKYHFGITRNDVMFCASDIGWIVGHSYILYAPLLVGATTILFEGKPIGTPDAGTFWRIIEEHKVNTLFTAPTALRAIKRDDPKNDFFKKHGKAGGFKQLRAIFLAGERSEPSIVRMYQDLLNQYAWRGAQVIDHWWSSEAGSPITGIACNPSSGLDTRITAKSKVLGIKPGAAGKPMPGFDVRVVDDDGNEVKTGEMGNIVMAIPLAPTAFTTLFNDDERFYKGYLKRFNGKWVDTGDSGMIDEDGYVSVMSRSDDIINVAAHRFSTGAIEQAISSHPSIAECCVVPIPDSLKGHLPFAFLTLSTSPHPESPIPSESLTKEIQQLVRDQIGAIAALGGLVQGKGMIPKTRSGKTLRRVLRELVENAVHGDFEKEVGVPATVEDAAVVEVAREMVRGYFKEKGGTHSAIEKREKAKL